jgi:hypothetical protein
MGDALIGEIGKDWMIILANHAGKHEVRPEPIFERPWGVGTNVIARS